MISPHFTQEPVEEYTCSALAEGNQWTHANLESNRIVLINFLPRRLRRVVERQESLGKVVNALGLFALVSIAFCIGIKYAEDLPWDEAAWQVWQTVTTVGYGNKPAAGLAGRFITMLLGLVGIALMGVAISGWFDWRDERRERLRNGAMDNPFIDGYLIVNFPGVAKFQALATELASFDGNTNICVLDSQLEHLPTPVCQIPGVKVHFVRGSLLSEATYRRAGADRCKVAIVFPQQTGVSESDATTRMIVDILSGLLTASARLSHILVSPENEWLFRNSRSNTVLEIDEILVLVQECLDPLSANVVQDLLRTSNHINPRTFPVGRLVGWTWAEFQRACITAAERDGLIATPLALIRPSGHDLLPAPSTSIAAEDQLSLVVPDGFDWQRFESSLMREGVSTPTS